ncbi:MAG TPA: cobalamin-dependent protein [Blastocatellia bacterium]|nr:cobalamin-dependent protein [Blastocatellia bacterium]
MSRSYSTKELARMWDVSESTIKRWADMGTLNCRKTVGGHRKFDLKDILEFASQSGLGAHGALVLEKEPARTYDEVDDLLARGDFAELSGRYRNAALGGQSEVTTELLARAYHHGLSLATIGDEIIKPAMHEIGEMWRSGKIRVFEEHLATFATLQSLLELHRSYVKKDCTGQSALVGCAEGESHEVASTLVRYLLEAEGWRVIHLGPHTPLFSFADAVNRFQPDMVCISVTLIANLERAAYDFEHLSRAASRHGTKIVMGGAALTDPEVRARFQGAFYAASLGDLRELLRQ